MNYRFSWSRTNEQMRFTDPDGKQSFCGTLQGQWYVSGVDSELGDLLVRCKLVVGKGGHATVKLEQKDEYRGLEVSDPEDINTRWRICFFREEKRWRLRQEQEWAETTLTDGFEGVQNVVWDDHSSHIFHEGPASIVDGVVMLSAIGGRPAEVMSDEDSAKKLSELSRIPE